MRREQAAASADPAEQAAAEAFIAKWQGVAASELSTSQSFLIDLCALPTICAFQVAFVTGVADSSVSSKGDDIFL